MSREPRRWYDIQAAVGDKATIRVYGDIGESWWDDNAVSAASFAEELDAIGSVGEIELHLNSPGGVAFDGVTIYNLLRDHPARVTVYVDGLAASAASIIAMAGDEVVMGMGSQLMIHDASIVSWGNADQLRKDADVVDSLSVSMASIYADRAGGDPTAWREVMKGEQWYTAEEAVEAGLADRRSSRATTEDGEPVDAAAMLRASASARGYRFKGRAEAPTPQTPTHPGGQQDNQGGAVEIADEDFTALRTTLGLGEDATIGDVLTAINERGAQADPPAAAAKLPDGVTTIDKGVLADLQASAALGVEAHKRQQAEARERLVATALADGKIRAADRDRWLKNLELDPQGFEPVLAALEPGLVPVTERGHGGGAPSNEGGEPTLEAVRASTHYAALREVI